MKIMCALILLAMPSLAMAWPAEVVSVHDGDTLTVVRQDTGERQKIRLYGVDCPELKQPFGAEALETTRSAVLGKIVDIEPADKKNSYGRIVAVVSYGENGETLQSLLSSSGMSWVDGRFCKSEQCETWRKHQEYAKLHYIGLWEYSNPVPPWTWRRLKR